MNVKLIAWDTSSKSGAIVAMEGAPSPGSDVRLVTELILNVELTHSERLLWGIHQVLESARWNVNEIDVLGVGVGPGSFTGLRVGLTTARTLAHTLKKPLVGVSSLAALARPAALHFSQKGWAYPTWVVAATDACKGELFALSGPAQAVVGCINVSDGTIDGNGTSLWKSEVVERVVSPEVLIDDLKKNLSQNAKARWVVVGQGRQRYLEEWNRLPKLKELSCPYPYSDQVQGRYLGQLAWEAYQEGIGQTGLKVHPRYLRASDAELKLKAGLLKRAPQE